MEEICKVVVIAAGGGTTVVLTSAVLVGLGFTATGIAAGSIAAKLMSYFAVLNGGGVVSGGVVAILQSLGAVGLSWGGLGFTGSIGGYAGWLISSICNVNVTVQE